MTVLITGSGLERHMYCRVSSVLERAFDERGSEYAQRGRATHEYLQRIAEGMSPAESLELVDEYFREGCRAIDLEDLDDALGMTPELALAYHPATDTARVLGSGLDRDYETAGVHEEEIPMSVDVAGIDLRISPEQCSKMVGRNLHCSRPLDHAGECGDFVSPSVGAVYDYKRGWSKRTPAERNWQMRGGALALARAFDLDEVRVQLIHLHEDRPAYRDRATFYAADLAMFAAEARVRHELAVADREAYSNKGIRPDATQGSWCDWCPSYHVCPAKTGLIRSVLAEAEIETRISAMTDAELALAFKKAKHAKQVLERIDGAIHAIASQRPILLERRADGTEEYLGMTPKVGNLKIDAAKARDIVREMLDAEAVEEVSKFTVTQELLEKAIKKRVPRGHGASKLRTVIEEMKKRGAATKPTKHDVGVYTIRPALAAKAG